MTLTAAFLESVPPTIRAHWAAKVDLEDRLEGILIKAQNSWPEISLAANVFMRFLAQRIAATPKTDWSMAILRGADLYLACACLEGDLQATRAFDEKIFPQIRAALREMNASPDLVDDVQQMLYQELFVARAGSAAKFAQYSGRGSLRNWAKISAVRIALRLMRKERKEVPHTETLLDQLTTDHEDQELRYFRKLYGDTFKAAFQQAVAALSHREYNVLRYHLQQGTNLGDIARLYHVHDRTVSRWLTQIRKNLLSETQKVLTKKLGANRSEVKSIIRLLQSQLEVSIRPGVDPR